ncbi:MAG: sugar phosphate isomerase/epimerase [Lachnospiraceae bacterium]|nr:sugar phosphate isomerase/epimerase [Lachnospiraceae bacterium]
MEVLSGIRGTVGGYRPKQGLSDLKGAGLTHLCLDLNLFFKGGEIANMGKEIISNAKNVRVPITEDPQLMMQYPQALLKTADEYGMHFDMGVAPIHPYGKDWEDRSEFIYDVTISSMKLCKQAECPYLLVYPISHEQSDRERVTAWYESLLTEAKAQGVTILIANQVRYSEGHWIRGIFAEPEELAAWIDAENEKAGYEAFAACLDIGNANLCGQDLLEMARALGERIRVVTLRENDGQEEKSMLPFSYTFTKPDYLGLIRGLREIYFDGLLYMDAMSTYGSYSTILRPALMRFVKEVGDYLMWQIGMEKALKKYPKRVLFGAGNMCRNYMKCYGKQYPPLFTCDNNESLWNTEFCGLTIREPVALLDIPQDCVIYICNLYYREIEEQLRTMGVKNPIEYFNDEYLPSYYTDRIARKSDV